MKLCVAGGGKIVRSVAPSFSGWGWEVCDLCVTPGGARRAADLLAACGNPTLYTDFSRMLGQTQAPVVYIAVPNHLHADFARMALEAGKHVILEKPLTSNPAQARMLCSLAKEKHLFFFEAITTLYQPDYLSLKGALDRIGTVKMVTTNFSQYSSRYDAFCRGEIAPAFDPAKSGGALMDLGVYNIHWTVGLFGPPRSLQYYPNMEKGIDTSGVLILSYPGFQAVSIAAKDSASPNRCMVQGTKGYLLQRTTSSYCEDVVLHLNDGTEEVWNTPAEHRLKEEFAAFARMMEAEDYEGCYRQLDHSLAVVEITAQARASCGLKFPGD